MNAQELAEIKERLSKATPGPYVMGHNVTEGFYTLDALRANGMGELINKYAWSKSEADRQFDLYARTDIPALVAKVERLQDENKTFHKMIDYIFSFCEGLNKATPQEIQAWLVEAYKLFPQLRKQGPTP
jgi:hypothetical protein